MCAMDKIMKRDLKAKVIKFDVVSFLKERLFLVTNVLCDVVAEKRCATFRYNIPSAHASI